MDQDMRDAAVAATEAAEPKTEAERLQKLFADQGIELSLEQIEAVFGGNRADDELAATSGDLADANALRDSGMGNRGRWIPGGGVYVGRGLGGGLADMLRAGVGAYRGKQARDKMDEIIEAKGRGVDVGTMAKVLAQMGPQKKLQAEQAQAAQAAQAAALRQAPAQAAPNYAYTGGEPVGPSARAATAVAAESQGGRVRQPVTPDVYTGMPSGGGPASLPVPQPPADASMMQAFLRNNKPIPPIPTPNGAGGRIASRTTPDFNPASYLSSLLKGNPAQTASNYMGGRNPASAMVVPPEEGISPADEALIAEALRGVRKTPKSWPIPPVNGGW